MKQPKQKQPRREPASDSRRGTPTSPPSRWAAWIILGLTMNQSAVASSSSSTLDNCDTHCGTNRVQICHYNGHSYQTVCIRRNSALRSRSRPPPHSSSRHHQQQQPPETQHYDYCGPCTTTTKAFETTEELREAVQHYQSQDHYDVRLAETYGWPLNAWNVSLIEDFSRLFEHKSTLAPTESLQDWDLSRATDLSFMFRGCAAFDGNSLRDWNTANVQTMEGLFQDAVHFNGAIQRWSTGRVTNMKGLLQNAPVFNQPMGSWDVANVIDASHLFAGAHRFDQDLSEWNLEAVWDVSFMFSRATSFAHDLSSWTLSSVMVLDHMMAGVPAFSAVSQRVELLEAWQKNTHHRNVVLGRVSVLDVFASPTLPAPVTTTTTTSPPVWPAETVASSVMLRGQHKLASGDRHRHVHLSWGEPRTATSDDEEDHELPSTLLHRELPSSTTTVGRSRGGHSATTTTTGREEHNHTYRSSHHDHSRDRPRQDEDRGYASYHHENCGDGFCQNTLVTATSV